MHTWQIHPPPRAVTSGGMLGAISVDSQILLQRSGLELGAGVVPHIGVKFISEVIVGILL